MYMAKKIKDNIKLFNKLCLNEHDETDDIVFYELLEQFEKYWLFKKIYLASDAKVKRAKKDKCRIKFIVEFDNKTKLKTFISKNKDKTISFNNKIFEPKFKKSQQSNIEIEIYFEEVGE